MTLRYLKVISIVLIVTLLAACSSIKLAYNFLGTIIEWRIEKYVSLNRKQEKLLDKHLNTFHSWHRQTQLTEYASYIEGVIPELEKGPITAEWIHGETDKVQNLLDTSLNQFLPIAVDLVHEFSDKQAKQVLHNMKKERDKFHKERVDISDKKRIDLHKKELSDKIGRFFGRFDKEQKQQITLWAEKIKPYEALSIKQQEEWSHRVAFALAVRHDKNVLKGKLGGIMLYRTDNWDPELETTMDYNQDITYELIADLINSQTDKQRRHMIKKLNKYRKDLLSLSK